MHKGTKNALIIIILFCLTATSLAYAVPPPTNPLIEISVSSHNETQPAVSYSTESGTYLVAYEDDDHVKLRMYDSTGQPLSPSPYDLGSNTKSPSIAYNRLHDEFGVAYIIDQDIAFSWFEGGEQTEIAFVRMSFAGASETLISTSVAFNHNDLTDDYMVVWQQGSPGDWSIYGHRFEPTSPYTPVGPKIDIALTTLTPGEEEAFSAPDITYNLNMNEYLVVFEYWTSDSSHTSETDILARRIRNDGSGPAPLPYITVHDGDCNQSHPTIAAYHPDTTAPYFVAYEDNWNTPCETETSIRGVYLEQDGTLPSTPMYLDISYTYQTREAHPDVTASEELGLYAITWAKDSGVNLDIYLMHIIPSGGLLPPVQLISGATPNARGNEDLPCVAIGATTKLVVWHEDGWGGGSGDVIGWLGGYFIYLPLIMN